MMHAHFCIAITFLNPRFHGRSDGGEPEWPPSPLRVVQAMIAGCAAASDRLENVQDHVRWLEHQPPPTIIAPRHAIGSPIRIAVPNNDLDVVAADWARGREPRKAPAALKTLKTIRTTHLLDGDTVYYLWRLPDSFGDEDRRHAEAVCAAARTIVALGWGIDLAVGHGSILTAEQANQFSGERWFPATHADGTLLRVPVSGTLDDLSQRHRAFVNRLTPSGLVPVAPLSTFRVVAYRRESDPESRPFAAFTIVKPDGSGYRAFDTARQATVVAGMVRHAVGRIAQQQRPFGWHDHDIAAIVQGHANGDGGGPARIASDAPRFAYLPLPSIERRGDRGVHASMIRRIIVAGRPGMAEHIDWVRRALSGTELIDEHSGDAVAILSLIPNSDTIARQYTRSSPDWITVTPVVLPGYDDRSQRKTDALLRKALIQAGYSAQLVQHAQLDWRSVGFIAGAELASLYRRPRNINEAPARHVSIRWRDAHGSPISVPGPLAVGSGRFRGLGLFVNKPKGD